MSTPRQHVVLDIQNYDHSTEDYEGQPGIEIFGDLVFNESAQIEYLSKDTCKKLKATAASGDPLDPSIANEVAQGMKKWALEHGATHYTHWFIPLTGAGRRKARHLPGAHRHGGAIAEFDGKTLIKGEPDASLLPLGRHPLHLRGPRLYGLGPDLPRFHHEGSQRRHLVHPHGLRQLHRARPWTTRRPCCAPWRPCRPRRSALLALFGNKTAKHVFTTMGPEQEYFLIDRRYYEQRPDLIAAGRTPFRRRRPTAARNWRTIISAPSASASWLS